MEGYEREVGWHRRDNRASCSDGCAFDRSEVSYTVMGVDHSTHALSAHKFERMRISQYKTSNLPFIVFVGSGNLKG